MSKAIQSVERVLSIIDLFNEKNYELGTQEISKQLMLSKSTVHGLFKTLESHHYLTQNPDNKKYKFGIRFFVSVKQSPPTRLGIILCLRIYEKILKVQFVINSHTALFC